MKIVIQRLRNAPQHVKAVEWIRVLSITGAAQVVVQGIGFTCGIIVIQLLPTKEYALYTLANTMLGTLLVLTDGGVSTGVMAQGGKVWQDREKLGAVISTGLDLRKKIAFVSLSIAIPALMYVFSLHQIGWKMTFITIASLVPSFMAALYGNFIQIPLKLHQDVSSLQKNQVFLNIGRLLALLSTLVVFPWAFVAMLAAGLPQVWSNLKLQKISSAYYDIHQKPNKDIRKNIMSLVKRILPGSIYYCVSGQISIWLISLFGSTTAIAEIGALGRLATLLSVINVLFGTLAAPRFARMPDVASLLFKRFLQTQSGLFIICLFTIGLAWLFPNEVLWILGKEYANLQAELVLNIVGSCLVLIAGVVFTLYTSRGWAINPLIYLPVNIITIVMSALFLDVSTVQGILQLNIVVAAVQVFMNMLFILIKIVKTQ